MDTFGFPRMRLTMEEMEENVRKWHERNPNPSWIGNTIYRPKSHPRPAVTDPILDLDSSFEPVTATIARNKKIEAGKAIVKESCTSSNIKESCTSSDIKESCIISNIKESCIISDIKESCIAELCINSEAETGEEDIKESASIQRLILLNRIRMLRIPMKRNKAAEFKAVQDWDSAANQSN